MIESELTDVAQILFLPLSATLVDLRFVVESRESLKQLGLLVAGGGLVVDGGGHGKTVVTDFQPLLHLCELSWRNCQHLESQVRQQYWH